MHFPRNISATFLDSNSVYFLLQIIGSNNFLFYYYYHYTSNSDLLQKMHRIKSWKKHFNSDHLSVRWYLFTKTIYLCPGTATGKLPVYIAYFIVHREDLTVIFSNHSFHDMTESHSWNYSHCITLFNCSTESSYKMPKNIRHFMKWLVPVL